MLLFCPVLPNVPTAHKIHHKRYQRRNFQITVFQIKTNLSSIRFICFTQNVLDALDQMHWMPQIQSQKLDFFFTELPLALPSLTAPRTVIFTVIKNIKISLFYNEVMFHSHRSLYRTLYLTCNIFMFQVTCKKYRVFNWHSLQLNKPE